MAPLSNEAVEMNTIETAPLHSVTIETVEASFVGTPVAVPVYKTPSPARTKPTLPVLGRATQDNGVTWTTAIFLAIFHIGAIAAFFYFSWSALAVFVVTYMLAINVGIGMCYHRLLTHRGYKVPKWVEYAMAIFATTALEGGPMFWVATHRVHHQYSDHVGDPHTNRRRLVGPRWVDIERQSTAHRDGDAGPLCAGPCEGSFLRPIEQVSLGSVDHRRAHPAGDRRLAMGSLGCISSCHHRAACNLAGEFRDSPMGFASL